MTKAQTIYTITSINTRGSISKHNLITESTKHADIILLQEQILDQKKNLLRKYEKTFNSKPYYSTNNQNNRTVITIIKGDLQQNITKTEELIKGRALSIELNINHKVYHLINIYGPAKSDERLTFVKELQTKHHNGR